MAFGEPRGQGAHDLAGADADLARPAPRRRGRRRGGSSGAGRRTRGSPRAAERGSASSCPSRPSAASASCSVRAGCAGRGPAGPRPRRASGWPVPRGRTGRPGPRRPRSARASRRSATSRLVSRSEKKPGSTPNASVSRSSTGHGQRPRVVLHLVEVAGRDRQHRAPARPGSAAAPPAAAAAALPRRSCSPRLPFDACPQPYAEQPPSATFANLAKWPRKDSQKLGSHPWLMALSATARVCPTARRTAAAGAGTPSSDFTP